MCMQKFGGGGGKALCSILRSVASFVTELSAECLQIDSAYSCGCRRPLRRGGVRTCPACFVLWGEKQTNWTKASAGLGWEMEGLES